MRRWMIATVALLSALTLPAAQRVGTLQLAGSTNLIRSLWKISGFTGDRQLSEAALGLVKSLPSVRFFGRGRSGDPTVFVLLKDEEESSCHTAVLYPVTVTPEEFLKTQDGAKRQADGTIKVPCEEGCDVCSATVWPSVVFSKDRRWAAGGDTAAEARLALKEIALAERPMSNDLIRVRLDAGAFPELFDGMSAEAFAGQGSGIGLTGASPAMASEVFFAARVNDRSLDLECRMRMKDKTGIGRWGRTALPADALSSCDTNAVMAYAAVAGFPNVEQNIRMMIDYLRRIDGDQVGCVAREVAPNFTAFRVGAGIKSGEVSWTPPTAASYGVSIVLDRAAGWHTDLQGRFDRVMPELKSRDLLFKFISLSHLVSPGTDEFMRPRRAVDRPTEGLFYAGWCEGEVLHCILRITAADVRVMLDSLGASVGSQAQPPAEKAPVRP